MQHVTNYIVGLYGHNGLVYSRLRLQYLYLIAQSYMHNTFFYFRKHFLDEIHFHFEALKLKLTQFLIKITSFINMYTIFNLIFWLEIPGNLSIYGV